MHIFRNLTLIGTSHVAIQSVAEAKNTILSVHPKAVALELDRARFLSLMKPKKKPGSILAVIRQIGLRGFIFSLIGAWIQKKIGKLVGSAPGTEMKVATLTAVKINAKVALIDRDIRVTLRHLFKYVTWKEKFRFIADIFKGIILRKPQVEAFDLRKVPPEKIINQLLNKTKKRYPGVYKALVQERNVYMAKNLYKLMQKYNGETIVALVGAGHEKDIINLIRSLEKKNGI
ncbi:MAG: TraB domain-containing protein [Nanoarchaeota archaeon]|nr:TraB domain-containing protein [Nanoarchaeota archaeon]